MSRYFFHVWTGETYEPDDTGIELASAEQAYLEAFDGAREICLDMLRQRRSAARYRFDIVDAHGRLVHSVPFTETMGKPAANRPASGFIASASRGYDLASDVVREIAKARENLRICRELLSFTSERPISPRQ